MIRLGALIAALLTTGALSATELSFKPTLLPVSGLKAGDQFGSAVAVGEKFIAVGAYLSDGGRGAVYLYERVGGAWSSPPEKLQGEPGEWFGFDVAFDKTGKILVVGAPSPGKTGRVYVYEPEKPRSKVEGGALGDEFGSSVSADQDWVAVGARGASQRAGRIYVFKLSEKPPQPLPLDVAALEPSAGAELGQSVSLRGKMLAAGAPLPGKDGKSPGAVFISMLSNETWEALKPVSSPGLSARSAFGYSVAVMDGEFIVGAPLESPGGAVYTCDISKCEIYLRGNQEGDQMGVAVAADGTSIVIGARGAGGNHGAVYLGKKELPSEGVKGPELGFGVAIRGMTIVAGAFREGGTGAAYVFKPDTPACDPGITLTSPEPPLTTSEDKASLTFTVGLTCMAASSVTLKLFGDADEATVGPLSLQPDGKYLVTVTGADDHECDGPRDYSFQVGDLDAVAITNLDNDICLNASEEACVTPDGVVVFEMSIENAGAGRLEDGTGNEHAIELPDEVRVVTATSDRGVVTVDHLKNTIAWSGSLPMGGEALITILAPLEPDAAPAYDPCP